MAEFAPVFALVPVVAHGAVVGYVAVIRHRDCRQGSVLTGGVVVESD